jgi:hypothetical protein
MLVAASCSAEIIRYDLVLQNDATGWIDVDVVDDSVSGFDIQDWSIDFGDGVVIDAPPYEIQQDFRGRDYVVNGTNMHAGFDLIATEDELLLPDELGARLVLGADESTVRWYTAIDWGTPNWWLQQPLDLSPHLLEWAETGQDQRWQTWTDTDRPSVIATRQQTLVALASHACSAVVVPEPNTKELMIVSVLGILCGSSMGYFGLRHS